MPGSKRTTSNILFQDHRISFFFCKLAEAKHTTLINHFPKLTHGGLWPLTHSKKYLSVLRLLYPGM